LVDTTPPVLIISSPAEGAELADRSIRFAGITEPGARVVAGPYQATVDSEGGWYIDLVLSEGANTARFRAVDAYGNETTATVTVYLSSPATTTEPATPTTKVEELAAFDANLTWGSRNIEPPYDEYFGTGQPGSEVVVQSEYGSGATVVQEDGTWYLKVEFPQAPPGLTFLVKVRDQYGRQEAFEFTSTVGA
jgi:hypothetical protein